MVKQGCVMGYRDWNDSDCDCIDTEECSNCAKLRTAMSNSREFFEAIFEALYSKDPLSPQLEEWIDEAAHALKIPLPKGDLTIERKNNTLRDIQFLLQKVS